jgi:uncharacterized damage-inducible protein DinB
MMNFSIDKALEILEQTPKTLTSLLKNLSDEWIYANEGGETWSAFDVVGHLIHGEKTDWTERLQKVMSDHDKNFEPFDRFAQFESSKGKSLHQLLETFQNLRAKNLRYFNSLNISGSDLDKTGIHPDFGVVTMRQLLSTWVAHDLGHIAQISRVLAKQYKHEVGPWTAYLSILQK